MEKYNIEKSSDKESELIIDKLINYNLKTTIL